MAGVNPDKKGIRGLRTRLTRAALVAVCCCASFALSLTVAGIVSTAAPSASIIVQGVAFVAPIVGIIASIVHFLLFRTVSQRRPLFQGAVVTIAIVGLGAGVAILHGISISRGPIGLIPALMSSLALGTVLLIPLAISVLLGTSVGVALHHKLRSSQSET